MRLCGCAQDVGTVARMCFLAEADAGSQMQSLLFVDILHRGSSQEDASQLQVAAPPYQGQSVSPSVSRLHLCQPPRVDQTS